MARVAGVSRQTVTRALNGLPDVSEATRKRVVAAARELNYRPNRSAQSLVRGRSVTVGLLVEDLANPYSSELAGALSSAAAARDWAVVRRGGLDVSINVEGSEVERAAGRTLLPLCTGGGRPVRWSARPSGRSPPRSASRTSGSSPSRRC